MKLVKTSVNLNRNVFLLELNSNEKFMSNEDLILLFQKMQNDCYTGSGYSIRKFENLLEITVYTD